MAVRIGIQRAGSTAVAAAPEEVIERARGEVRTGGAVGLAFDDLRAGARTLRIHVVEVGDGAVFRGYAEMRVVHPGLKPPAAGAVGIFHAPWVV